MAPIRNGACGGGDDSSDLTAPTGQGGSAGAGKGGASGAGNAGGSSSGSGGAAAARQQTTGEFDGVRGYRRGDPLKLVVWKKAASAMARGSDELVSRDTQQTQRYELWLDFAHTGLQDTEGRLSRLCAWVLQADRLGVDYGLRLPLEVELVAFGHPRHLQRLRGVRGRADARVEVYGQALPVYQQLTALQPRVAEVWGNRGNCLCELGREREALDPLQTARQLGGDGA